MQFLFRYIKPHLRRVAGGTICKFLGTVMDLLIPALLAYMLDDIVPTRDTGKIYLYGGIMVTASLLAWIGNVFANRGAAGVARDCTRQIRHDLFGKITRLTSPEIDRFTIPSLISRMMRMA